MPVLREYEDEQGRSPFGRWFSGLTAPSAAKVTVALTRLGTGNTSALKGVGKGVSEVRIGFGPGLRVYVGQDGTELVILLGGSAKAWQQQAIAEAQERWADYKARKRRGP